MAYLQDNDTIRTAVSEVQRLLEHEFLNPNLLLQALTHSSYSNERNGTIGTETIAQDNERLEFLGDAVIGLAVARRLMELFPEASEGMLSRWRSTLVSRKTLAELAQDLNVGDLLLLGRGERRTGGAEKRSILAAGMEALVGALYLDAGLEKAAEFLNRVYGPSYLSLTSEDHALRMLDKKTHLQEKTQQIYRSTPLYRLVDSWGAEHEKTFRVEIEIAGKVVASGDGRSKKEAEQQAAGAALEVLGL